MSDIKKEIEKLEGLLKTKGDELDNLISKGVEQSKAASLEAIKKMEAIDIALKDEIKSKMSEYVKLSEKSERLEKKSTEIETNITSLQKQYDELSVKFSRPNITQHGGRNFQDALYEIISKDDKLSGISKQMAEQGIRFKGTHSFELKGVDFHRKTNMTQAATVTGTFPLPQQVPGVQYDPDTMFSIRNLVTVSPCNSNSVIYQRETGITNNTGTVAQGSALGKSSVTVATTTRNVQSIGTYLKMSEEMIADIAIFTAYISQRFQRKLVVEENKQAIFGDGQGNNLYGIATEATAYSDILNMPNGGASLWDVLLAAVTQIEDSNTGGEYVPNAILVTPTFFMQLQQEKDANYNYIAPGAIFTPFRPTINGIPIISTSAMQTADGVKDGFLVGDFRMGSTLFDRMSPVVEMTNTDQDDFIKKLVTVRIWERVAMANINPNAFRYGNFIAAKDLANY